MVAAVVVVEVVPEEKLCARLGTKWSRFEVVGVHGMQSCRIREHAKSDVHKLAAESFFNPGVPLVLSQDVDLLRGAVPQVGDWLRAWRAVRTPVSWTAAELAQKTEAFVERRVIGDSTPTFMKRKVFAAMTRIMAEVTRREKRASLRQATAISISVDDRQAYRLIRYKCAGPISQRPSSESGPSSDGVSSDSGPSSDGVSSEDAGALRSRSGVLAVLRRGGVADESIESIDEDYSVKMRDSILRGIERLCTPAGGARDDELVQHVLDHVLTFCADGAAPAQKCGKLLKEFCRRLTLVWRDVSHALRIAGIGSLKCEPRFASFWSDVFDARHALVPDIQNSDAWRAKLMMAQKRVMSHRGSQGGGLEKVMQHFAFAKQRMDSAAEPARKYCCLVAALAVLLCSIAADERVDRDVRRRAQTFIDKMTPKHFVDAGLFADFSSSVLAFVRVFDVEDHDPAMTMRQKTTHMQKWERVFVDGQVLAACPLDQGMTCTQIAIDQAMACGPIYYGNRCLRLWPQGAAAEVGEAAAGIRRVVEASISRVHAELSTGSLQLDFCVFDLKTWHRALRREREGNDDLVRLLARKAGRICKALPLVPQACPIPSIS